jgi:PEP-CTERM motif
MNSRARFTYLIGLLCLLCLMLPGSLRADTVYTYTGTPYSYCTGSYTCNGTTPSLNVTLDLGSALAGGLTFANITGSVNSFSFDDGVDVSLTNTNATASQFYVTTDASGNITGWTLEAAENCYNGFDCFESGYGGKLAVTVGGSGFDYTFNNIPGPTGPIILGGGGTQNAPGQWSTSTPTPEPSTLLLFGSGLPGLLVWAKRRKRHGSPTSC